jgi:Conserved hypothetical protein (Lin0512_fam)
VVSTTTNSSGDGYLHWLCESPRPPNKIVFWQRQRQLHLIANTGRCFSTSSKKPNNGDNDGSSSSTISTSSSSSSSPQQNRVYWNEEWERLGLGATIVKDNRRLTSCDDQPPQNLRYHHRLPENLFFVQLGFGVDQHGDTTNDATKAAVRAVRNAIEFNSIPGVVKHIPGGRHEMLIHVKLGVPPARRQQQDHDDRRESHSQEEANRMDDAITAVVPSYVDTAQVAKVFPYGKLLPIDIVVGGIDFHSGRVVEELGDKDDVGICCVACVTIGYDDDKDADTDHHPSKNSDNIRKHETFNTKDGY